MDIVSLSQGNFFLYQALLQTDLKTQASLHLQVNHYQKIIIEPNSPSKGLVVAFIEVNGAPVELMEYK